MKLLTITYGGLMEYRKIKYQELNIELFHNFIRHQEVTKCWRKENVKWQKLLVQRNYIFHPILP